MVSGHASMDAENADIGKSGKKTESSKGFFAISLSRQDILLALGPSHSQILLIKGGTPKYVRSYLKKNR